MAGDPSKPLSGIVARYGALQTTAEVGLGSVLHAFHVPLAGHLLSLNQGALLTLATRGVEHRRDAVRVSSALGALCAGLKALSPAGKRLTPMLAILTQAQLFALGPGLVGCNRWGSALGLALLSLWGFVQPLAIALLLFGSPLLEAAWGSWLKVAEALHWTPTAGLWALGGVVAFKAAVAFGLGWGLWSSPRLWERHYADTMDRWKSRFPRPQRRAISPWRGALRDILQPWFLGTLVLTVTFFALLENDLQQAFLSYGLRPLVVGALLFWGVRKIPGRWLERGLRRFPLLQEASRQAPTERSLS